VEDERKLERVLGYLRMTKSWTRAFDRSPFDHVTMYLDASFATHQDGKGQSACMVMLGDTLVHESGRKQKNITRSFTEVKYIHTSSMLVYILTKAFGGEHFHDLAEILLEKHHFLHSSNRGAKNIMRQPGATVESVTPAFNKLYCANCSNQKKHVHVVIRKEPRK
jgi:hypothetical protein